MLAAQTGDTYLTSGMVGDAFGVAAAMIVPEWAFYREIAQDAAVYHDNTVEGLSELLRSLSVEQIRSCQEASKKLQSAYDWAVLSPNVYSILREMLI
jgi:hypothetical protein